MLKKWIRRAHLILGLVSGAGVFVLAVTGALLAFEQELRDLTEPWRFAPATASPLPPSALIAAARPFVPGKAATAAGYEGEGRSATVEFYKNGEKAREYWIIAYLDPRDGRVLKVVDRLHDADFFQFALDGHTRYWMPRDLGHALVSYTTLIFTGMLISGIVLWWPRNRKALGQRLQVKWNTGWKRRRYDLHTVLGFYGAWVLIFIALTGLAWTFSWFADSVQWAASGGKAAVPWSEPASDTTAPRLPTDAALDAVWRRAATEERFASLSIRVPQEAAAPVTLTTNPDAGVYFRADYRFFDRNTLKELPVRHAWGRYADAGFAGRLQRAYYDVHVGAILGLPGKFLAFCAALIAASLPVTGFLMWLGKRRKRRKPKASS